MQTPEINNSTSDGNAGPPDDVTGLPALPTWRGVYTFVLLVFVTYVVLLTILSKVFA